MKTIDRAHSGPDNDSPRVATTDRANPPGDRRALRPQNGWSTPASGRRLDLDRAVEQFPAESHVFPDSAPRTAPTAAEPTVFTIVPAGPPKPYPMAPRARARRKGPLGWIVRLAARLGRALRAVVMAPIHLVRQVGAAAARLARSVRP